MLMKTRYLFQRHEDFCIETTLATRSLLKTIQTAQADGYSVTVLYFWLDSPDRAVDRVRARVAAGGHNIAEETIRRRYYVGLHYFFRFYVPACDRWILADNSIIPFTVVAEGTPEGSSIHDPAKYELIRSQNERFESYIGFNEK